MQNLNKFIITLLFFIFISNIQAQETENDSLRNNALNVFMDCNIFSMDYIKDKITFVNYVRDQKDAQLYIMVTSRITGSGGIEYKMYFIGRKEFTGKNDTLQFIATSNNTEDERRKKGVLMLKMGLMYYVAKTPLANEIMINFTSTVSQNKVVDKWKSWIFNVSANGSYSGQEKVKTSFFSSTLNVAKVTERYKLKINSNYSTNNTEYKLNDTTTFNNISNTKNIAGLFVKSISEHCSLGATLYADASIYNNNKHSYRTFPAIEYDFYKYSESSRRQLCFLYQIGRDQREYNDTTIYNKLRETLFLHSLSISYNIKETWGSIYTSIFASQYLHDISKNNLNLSSSLNIRIYKGLSFNVSGNVNLIHDQLSLPKGVASLEQILTYQKQLASQYSYSGSIGFSYTFGSIYNNVVNPRFGN